MLARRKSRLREEKSHHHVKRLNRSFKLSSKKRTYQKPEHFIMKWRRETRDAKRMQRVVSNPQFLADVPKEDEQKVVVVFRHRAHQVANEECAKILQTLGLGRLHNTVLLKNSAETVALLKIVDPYVCYGFPNIQTVRDLIFKHGFLQIDGKKTAINSNKLIEDQLGEHGCICIEDVVHDLFTVSDNFKNVRKLLVPFKVSGIWIIFFMCVSNYMNAMSHRNLW